MVPKNPSTTSRTGTITLTQSSSGKTLSISVTQSGCEETEGSVSAILRLTPEKSWYSGTVSFYNTKTFDTYRVLFRNGKNGKLNRVSAPAGEYTVSVSTTCVRCTTSLPGGMGDCMSALSVTLSSKKVTVSGGKDTNVAVNVVADCTSVS